MRQTLVLFLFLTFSQSPFAQLSWQWSKSLCTSDFALYKAGTDVKADGHGNVVVLGHNAARPGAASIISGAGSFVGKFSANGSILWQAAIPGRAVAFDLDKQGNVLVTGTFSTSSNVYGYGQAIFVQKLDQQGALQWQKVFSGGGSVASSIACSDSGNVLLCGSIGDGIMVQNKLETDTHGLFVMKLTENGNLAWLRKGSYFPTASGKTHERGEAIAVDKNENVYVAYQSRVACGYFYEVQTLEMMNGSGQLLNRQEIGGTMDEVWFLAVDQSGGVYCAHEVNGGTSSGDYVLSKWSAGLQNLAWRTMVGGYSLGYNVVSRPALHKDGTLFITGDLGHWSQNSQAYPLAIEGNTYTSEGLTDLCVVRISASTGSMMECKTAAGLKREGGTAIAVNSSGSAFVTGYMNMRDYDDFALDTVCFDQYCLSPNDLYSRQFLARLQFSDISTSVNDRQEEKPFVLFPNPGNGQITIQSPHNEKYLLRLYDMNGAMLEEKSHTGTAVLEIRAPGVYVIGVYCAESTRFLKAIVR